MKILQYSSSLSRSAGGLYYSVSGLSKGLSAHGADVCVVGGADSHFDEDRHIWSDLEISPHPLKYGRYGFDPRVLLEIKRQQPDLVHIHGIWNAASIYGRFAALLGIPLVVSPRGMLDPWILARKPTVKKIHSALIEKPMLSRAYVHALNQSERTAAIEFLPSLGERTFIIPNGIADAETISAEDKRNEVLYLGRLHEKKQVLELIQQWRTRAGDSGLDLVIAGWGDNKYETEVAKAVDGATNVRFVGPLYGEDKVKALRAARFFILPSLSEGLPMAVLEGIQYGCIPIITDGCNLPEMFTDKVAFHLATDFSNFGDVVREAGSLSVSELVHLSERATDYSKRFLWSNISAKMLQKYQEIIAGV